MTSYIHWHYFVVFKKLLLLWRNLTLFPYYYFSIPLHVSTLFAPWKRQTAKTGVGFDLGEFFTALSFNLISRSIGFVLRFITILYGLLFMLFFLVVFSILVVLWMICPFVTLPIYYFKSATKEEKPSYILARAGKNLKNVAILLFQQDQGEFVSSHLAFEKDKLIEYFKNQEDTSGYEQFLSSISVEKEAYKLSIFFDSLAKSYKPFQTLLSQNSLKSIDVYKTALWFEMLYESKKPFLMDIEKIKKIPGIGIDWAYGYTPEFSKYSDDLSKLIPSFPLLVGREKEIEEMEQILEETESNNILIIGQPGVARHILVETLAHRILTGSCPKKLSHKRILMVNMHSLLAAKPSVTEVKGIITDMFEEARKAGNVIIAIDEIDKYVTGKEGKVDIADVITRFAKSELSIIGITTPENFHQFIEPNQSVSSLFEKLYINPPNVETVLKELKVAIAPVLEKKYNIIITYQAIQKTIEDADRFINATPYPAKAINLLDEASIYLVNNKNESILRKEHIDEFLSHKLNLPLGELEVGEKERLVKLEEEIHKRVINQNQAVNTVSAALRRARLNIQSRKKPAGCFLFLGPTGVGKTETAKALASTYFGSEESLLRFDMSQFQGEEGIERLIGSAKSALAGELTSALRDRPFSVVLLDEFEKSTKEIYNLFLTLFDEGYITDSLGKKVDAKNSIIIATSNAGAEYIREKINEGVGGVELEEKLVDYVQKQNIFSPELLNRFDSVIVFTPLSEGHLREIAKMKLKGLNQRLKAKEVSVAITPDLIKKLALLGFDPQFGARKIERVITEKIEDLVAKKLLEGNVRKGEEIEIDL